MKRLIALVLAAVLLVGTVGCSTIGEMKLEDLEIFKNLKNGINPEDTLEKIVDSFAKICEPLLSDEDNRYLFVADAYEEGENHCLKLVMAMEFKVPVYPETLRLDLQLIYKTDEDMSLWEENKWVEKDFDAYIDYIKNSNIFLKLLGKTVDSFDLNINKA